VTLTDASPLIAIIDADEPDHVTCLEALDRIVIPTVTAWPAFTAHRDPSQSKSGL